ncbi:hypothetical protein Jiend_47670 [Micromonospora endophytica]|nr:hypothetical protein Jiend_47670 [Micromonospora endophytica]
MQFGQEADLAEPAQTAALQVDRPARHACGPNPDRSPRDDEAGEGARWWLWAAGAGVVVLLAAGWAVARRRRS